MIGIYKITSPESRCKISLSQFKIVIDLQTGVFYNSARELSILYKINESTIKGRLNVNLKNNTQFRYA